MDYAVGTCDDLAADRDHLAALVRQWAARAGHTVKIAAFFSAENFLFHYAEEAAYDILLLDIEMGAMDGVSLAKKIRQKEDTVQIVFITGYSDYIAEGYELKLENVSFRYPGTDRDVIRHMDLTLRPGEKVAVVGLNGAGKTTLVKLLCGFYDPDEGRVLLNGVDIRQFDRRAYYDLFSAVFQEASVLDVTVAEHVAQRVENIDLAKVSDCLDKAGLTAKVEGFPRGLQTHVGKIAFLDGVEFSGGEMQRLMLARALYKDGPILVLDEPTAALDPIAEAEIYEKFDAIAGDKTAIYISHRLSSCKFCDEIAVFHGGAVIQQGTHAQLLADESGKYHELWMAQAQYYVRSAES